MGQSKSFPLFEPSSGQNGHTYNGFDSEEESLQNEDFALTDELDHEILMQRDAHFGGDFKVMLQYYQNEGIGAHPDIDLDRILYLAKAEEELGQDLAPFLLTGPEAERVARSRRAYENLKEIYEESDEKNVLARLLADLILSEEEEPEKEIEAVVAQGKRIVDDLLRIVESDDAYDPLFPGYGYAPYLAIICLGKIGDERAIIPLFETLGKEIVFEDEVIAFALAQIGELSKKFLLKVLKSRPLTKDNVHAAFALTAFAEDEEVSKAALEQLFDPDVREKPLLRNYLLYAVSALESETTRDALLKMAKDPDVPEGMQREIEKMLRPWL